jgi:hypothetical protein
VEGDLREDLEKDLEEEMPVVQREPLWRIVSE